MSRPPVVRRILGAVSSHLGVVIGGSAAVLAALLHAWSPLAIGLVACGALVLAERAGTKSAPRRSPTVFRDPETLAALESLRRARRELDQVLADTAPALVQDLAPALQQIGELEARAESLLRRSEEIAIFLAKTNAQALERESQILAERTRRTADPTARAHFAAAHAARTEHLATLRTLAGTKERIGATLLSIAAALDGMAPKIVRLRGLDGGGADRTRDVDRDLATMSEELSAFEEVLVEVGEAAEGGLLRG